MATAGPNLPTAVVEHGGSGDNWTGVSNALTKDGSTADATLFDYTNALKFSEFGFAIPEDATIDGFEMRIRGKTSDPDLCNLAVVGLSKASPFSFEFLSGLPVFTTSLVEYVAGGPTDKAGTTWTPAQVNAPGFTAFLTATVTGGLFGVVSIDWVEVTVYYTEAEGGGGSSRRASRKMLKGL